MAGRITSNGTKFLSTLSLRRATWGAAPPSPPKAFLSTLSLRRATTGGQSCNSTLVHFYPRSPCGERPYMEESEPDPQGISIHALLAESDTSSVNVSASGSTFLSTLSLRRATTLPVFYAFSKIISIHALLAESDSKSAQNSGALLRI